MSNTLQCSRKKKNPRAAWEREPTAKARSGAHSEAPVPEGQRKTLGTASHAMFSDSSATFLFALLSTDLWRQQGEINTLIKPSTMLPGFNTLHITKESQPKRRRKKGKNHQHPDSGRASINWNFAREQKVSVGVRRGCALLAVPQKNGNYLEEK